MTKLGMKIGLLTTYSFNYGSYHQAVALQKKLIAMGHECELINEKTKMFKWFNLFCMYAIDPILPSFAKDLVAKKIPQYNSFRMIENDTKFLPVSPPNILSFAKLSKRYDCIVVGSDELWSASADSIRFCPEYFGLGWTIPLISYATCAIKLAPTDETICAEIKKGLSKFSAISVRDEKSLRNIKAISADFSAEIVLDPTLLYPYFVPENIEEASDKYFLLYGQHYDDRQKEYIRKLAEKEKAKVYCVGWEQPWADGFLNVTSAKELQEVFAAANFCFPSTFHGTIFSILNRKQFIAMLNPLRGKKVELLLHQLGLEHRIFEEDIMLDKPVNYDKVSETLDSLRTSSERYLKNALEEVQRQIGK